MADKTITHQGKKYEFLQTVEEGNEQVIDRIKETAGGTKNAFKCKLLVHVVDEVTENKQEVQAVDKKGVPKVNKKGKPVMVEEVVSTTTVHHVYIHKTK